MNCCIKRETEEEAYENAKNIALKPKIPRPPNAFMLYANENRKIMAQQFPADSNKEISKKLGSSWKNLDIEEKNKYFDRARLIDLEHKKKYPNYVYNPKEARIRKAMREATRDRSIGASPMLPRPSARRAASQGWTTAHEEQLMMSPMAAGMRGALNSPVCFPISSGTGSSQFMPPMSAGYSKLESPLPPPPSASVHTNYMQPNPLAQLQQQTEMWNNFQDDMRSRASGNPYMMQEVGPPFQHHQPSPPLSIPSPVMMMDKQHRQTPHALHPVNGTPLPMTPPLSNISMTPPHSNENVPPDEGFHPHQACKSSEEAFESKHVIDPVQPLMENNMQPVEGYMPVYDQSMASQSHFQKMEDVKVKKVPNAPHVCPKNPSCKNMLYLPLSCTNFCASPDLFTNNIEYQREYITKYFQNSPDYDVLSFITEDGDNFPYATFSNSLENTYLYEDSPQPNFIQTDVGYIPVMFDSCRNIISAAKCDSSMQRK